MTCLPVGMAYYQSQARLGITLLRRPDDAGDPVDILHLDALDLLCRTKGGELDGLGRLAMQDAREHVAVRRLGDDAVALADRGRGRDDDDIAFAIDGQHALALYFDRIGILVDDAGRLDLVPCGAGGEARIVEEAGLAHLGEADHRDLTALGRLALAAAQEI